MLSINANHWSTTCYKKLYHPKMVQSLPNINRTWSIGRWFTVWFRSSFQPNSFTDTSSRTTLESQNCFNHWWFSTQSNSSAHNASVSTSPSYLISFAGILRLKTEITTETKFNGRHGIWKSYPSFFTSLHPTFLRSSDKITSLILSCAISSIFFPSKNITTKESSSPFNSVTKKWLPVPATDNNLLTMERGMDLQRSHSPREEVVNQNRPTQTPNNIFVLHNYLARHPLKDLRPFLT